MSELVHPRAAAERIVRRLADEWAEHVVGERTGASARRLEITIGPGLRTGTAVARAGFAGVTAWTEAWADVDDDPDRRWTVRSRTVVVEKVKRTVPAVLELDGLDGALAFVRRVGVEPPSAPVDRARRLAASLTGLDVRLTPATLRAACRLSDGDLATLVSAVHWLADEPDVTSWTSRQLPVPGMHTKWLGRHGGLLRDLTGRDLRHEVRPRLAVVHVTYVDPGYLAGGGRRHDSWTAGDTHELAYRPSTVLVVENRDCRLWFPPVSETVVVEGGGKAAATLLADIPWVRTCERLVYWGDIDADGFLILDVLRAVMARPPAEGEPAPAVESLLMDADALERFGHLGVTHDERGRPIAPSSYVPAHLSPEELTAYYTVATGGTVPVRRVEQERIPLADAAASLGDLLDGNGQGPADR